MRAFVIGNGPSLLHTPMDKLRNEFTIGMNRLFLLGLDWDPTWWLLTDVSYGDEWDWPFMAARKSKFFVKDHEREVFEPHRTEDVEYFRPCGHNYMNRPHLWHMPEFCRWGGGITAGMQLAVREGADEIYLVGTDLYEYRPPGPDINHFHPEYSRYKIRKSTGEEVNPPENWDNLNERLIHAHKVAKQSADLLGIPIYNATVGGKLEVYPRVNITDVLQ